MPNEPFNKYQRFVLDNYENGDFAHIKEESEIEGAGDGLLEFLVVELSDNEDCTSAEVAFSRLITARDQINELLLKAEGTIWSR